MDLLVKSVCTCFILSISIVTTESVVLAQSPYQLDWAKETAIIGTSLGMHTGSAILKNRIRPLSQGSIARLMADELDDPDDYDELLYSEQARSSSDIARNIGIALPFALLVPRATRSEFGKIAIMLTETYGVVSGATYLAKTSVLRPRPLVYNPDVKLSEKQQIGARLSFFSGHTSVSAGLSFFGAKVFSDYHPNSKLKPYIWATAATIPAITGYLRVRAGKHFTSDVITGYIVGGLTGFFIPHMHRRDASETGWNIYSTGEGVGFRLTF